jgi:hypothetical protein
LSLGVKESRDGGTVFYEQMSLFSTSSLLSGRQVEGSGGYLCIQGRLEELCEGRRGRSHEDTFFLFYLLIGRCALAVSMLRKAPELKAVML